MEMEMIPVDVTLKSAKGLKDVNLISKMDVYATATISNTTHRTQTDKDSGPNPTWNQTLKFTIPESQSSYITLTVRLVSERSLGDKPIGEVNIPLKDLIARTENNLSYSVALKNGKFKGTLDLSVKFGDKFSAPAPTPPPNFAYPLAASTAPGYPPASSAVPGYPPAPAYNSEYPPAQKANSDYPPTALPGYPPGPAADSGYPTAVAGGSGYAYPYPAAAAGKQGGYGYPPTAAPYGQQSYGQQQAFGYPPMAGAGPYGQQQQAYGHKVQKPKRGGGNMMLGMGAGLLGGLLIGDMVSDAASFDAGGGFDDVGFDF